MKTMKWLLRREFWENKGSLFWAPIVVALVMLTFVGGTMGYGLAKNGGLRMPGVTIVNGHEMTHTQMINLMPLETKAKIADVVANTYLAAAAPLLAVLPVVVFFYCLSALYDDRRDRSILFWKSLPVSDQMTVWSKVLTALCVAPVITIAIGTAVSVLMIAIGLSTAALSGLNLFGLVLSQGEFYLAPLRLLALLPVYALWAIPTVGWLLMVSAWARSKVFLWAVGVPVLSLVLVKWANFIMGEYMGLELNVDWFAHNVVLRGLAGLVPGIWLPFAKVDPNTMINQAQRSIDAGGVFTQSWMTLTQPDVWVGVIVGGAMIFVAMRLRRWRDEG
jgi:ABC-2 type transport system permease protein